MSVIRRVPLKNVSKVIDVFDLIWNTITDVCSHNIVKIMYDSYIKSSLKACKRDSKRKRSPRNHKYKATVSNSSTSRTVLVI